MYDLTLNAPKTKLLGLDDELTPLELSRGVMEVVDHFKYLGRGM